MSDVLKTLADEFLGATNPPFAELHPIACRELLHAFAEYLEGRPIQISRSVTAKIETPSDAEIDAAMAGDHPHQIESHTLEDLDEEFRRK